LGQIYKHTSPSGKSYIGQTNRTWQLRAGKDPIKGYHGSTKFKNAIRKYGWENFTHEILEEDITYSGELDRLEKFWIENLDTVKSGYNSLAGATGISYPSAGEIPIKLRNLSKEELENLYVIEGYSAKEIAEMFDSNHNSVIAALQIHRIPRRSIGSPGKRERELNKLKALKEIACSICGNSFMPTKKDVQACSRSCRGKLAAIRLGKNGQNLKKVKRLFESMEGVSSKSVGAIVAGHNRWHVKRDIVNPDCSLCVTDESLLQVS
jgi:group I intron endonuclease